jgi:hypothetical protein
MKTVLAVYFAVEINERKIRSQYWILPRFLLLVSDEIF